jgi:hypothetical protein
LGFITYQNAVTARVRRDECDGELTFTTTTCTARPRKQLIGVAMGRYAGPAAGKFFDTFCFLFSEERVEIGSFDDFRRNAKSSWDAAVFDSFYF